MRIDEAFDILGIEITKDKKKIKSTFAKKVKECHPEEDEAGWKNLYDAYGAAMNYAKDGAVYAQPLQQEVKPKQKEKTQQEIQKAETTEETNHTVETEESQKEYEEIFGRIEDNTIISPEKLKEEYEEQFKKLIDAGYFQSYKCWKKFMEHEHWNLYAGQIDFWKKMQAVLRNTSISAKAAKYIGSELKKREDLLRSTLGERILSESHTVQAMCLYKVEKSFGSSKFRNKKYSIVWKMAAVSVALLAVFFVSLFLLNKPDTTKEKSYDSSAPISSSNVPQNENSSTSSTRGGSKDYNRDASKGGTSNTPAIGELLSADDFKEEITNYLNEKYGEGTVQADDLVLQPVMLEQGSNYYCYYKGQLSSQPDKKVFSWGRVESGNSEVFGAYWGIVCFDNFQQAEIERALKDEVEKTLGISEGMMYLTSCEPSFAYERFDMSTPAYHALYQGDLEAFFEEESQWRMDWQENDTTIAEEEMISENGAWNGRYTVWFPDENVSDVKSLVEDGTKSSGIDKDAIANLEQKYKIEIIVSALPQDLYHQLNAVKGEEKEGVTDVLKQKNLSEDNAFVLPFITAWYNGAVDSDGYSAVAKKENGISVIYPAEKTQPEVTCTKEKGVFTITAAPDDCGCVVVINKDDATFSGKSITVNLQVGGKNPKKQTVQKVESGMESLSGILEVDGYLFIPCTDTEQTIILETK